MTGIKKTSVLIAPGQGGQRPNLYELAERLPEVKETYDNADEISLELFGKAQIEGSSLSHHAKQASQEELAANTIIAQPLIVATSIGLIKYIKKQEGFTTAYGHSLGELSALFAAGSLSESDAIRLSMLRGRFSKEASSQRPGAMAAMMNLPAEIREHLPFSGEQAAEGDIGISTENNPDEITISGPLENVEAMVANIRDRYQKVKGLSKEEKRQLPNAVKMKIDGAFHSWIMRPAQNDWRVELDGTNFRIPNEMNYYSNHSHTYEASPEAIRHHLVEQLVHPVKFWYDIGRLIADGHMRIVESGAGSVLSRGLRHQQAKGRLQAELEIIAAEDDLVPLSNITSLQSG